MTEEPKQRRPIPLLALVLAWIIPGAGHIYLRRHVRGLVIFLTVGGLFWAGVAIGGVMTVDPQDEPWWFSAQMISGVHGLVSWQRQKPYRHILETDAQALDPANPKHIALVAPTDTVARAYSGVAGLLNLLCIFDALMLAMMGITGEGKSWLTRRHQPDAAREAV